MTIDKFRKWLREQFCILECFARYGDDYYLTIQVEAIVDEARRLACRFMADPGACAYDTHAGLAYVGRLLRELPSADVLTVKQAAERLNVSARTIYDLVECGRLRCLRVGRERGTIRIRPADLQHIMEPAPRLDHLTRRFA